MEIFWRVVYEFRRIDFSMQVYFLTLKIIRLARGNLYEYKSDRCLV